jgi:DNA polymerase III subunit alpha
MYISSLIPSERGIQFSLDQCYNGDEDHAPVGAFVVAMNTYPELWSVSRRIEGLITRLGIHAAGVILGNSPITEYNSIMRTSKGFPVTAFDLHDSEYLGEVKYDFLSIDGLGKINAALNFMLKDDIIQWRGSLKNTYQYTLWPNLLKYTELLWEKIANNEINSLWQLNTDVGTQALANIHATSLKEIGMINSLMRLMPQNKGDEQPIKTFERFRDDLNLWYQEMHAYGLSDLEVKILEDHLLILNGIADTQESVMLLTMDPRISRFNIAEANKLRKGIAKKSVKAQEEAKVLFFSKGKELGTSRALLNYIWDVQISRQLGYSFSLPHVAAYSIIAIQQANLYTYFPSIYWNTACLTIDAGANQEEDLQDLIQKGYIKPSVGTLEDFEVDEEGNREMETTTIDRGKIAYAISTFQKTTDIEPPNINSSGFGFMPDKDKNTIVCGLKIVSKMGDQLIYNTIFNRPYVSFDDYIDRVKISKDRVVNLIKANAFRDIDERDPLTLLRDYVREVSEPKKRLTLQNVAMLIENELLPPELEHQKKVYMWVKYIRKTKHESFYKLDERALTFYEKVLDQSKLSYQNNGEYLILVDQKYVDKYYESEMAKVKAYIAANHEELLTKLNENLFLEQWEKYGMDNIAQGEMQSMRMYVNDHELADVSLEYEITDFDKIEEEEPDGNFFIEGKIIPRYVIRHIVGTVIDKDKLKSKITVLTPTGPTEVKIWKNQFAFYDQTLTDLNSAKKKVIQPSFFEIGTHVMLTGMKRGSQFVLKKYRNTKVDDVILKINLTDEGFSELEAKIKPEDPHS